jgi:LCP family protein required for cell wall assembly
MNARRQWSKSKKILLAGIALVVVLAVSGGIYQYVQMQNTKRIFEEQQELKRLERLEQESAKESVNSIYQEDRINLLVMGFDKDESRLDAWRLFRPDAIVLVSLNLKDDSVDLVSIPRDSLVWIAHRPGKDKINAAFYYGHDLGGGKTDAAREIKGYEYVVDTVSEFFGNVYINNYMAMDMDGFMRLVDDMGGVEMDMEEEAYDPVDWAMLYGKTGRQQLSGFELLMYVRYRAKDSTRDIDRVERTQQAFQAVYTKLRAQNMVTMLPKLIENYKDNVDTNLTLKEMSSLALYAQKIDLANMNKHVVDGTYEYRENNIYYIPDEDARVALVEKVFGIEFTPKR